MARSLGSQIKVSTLGTSMPSGFRGNWVNTMMILWWPRPGQEKSWRFSRYVPVVSGFGEAIIMLDLTEIALNRIPVARTHVGMWIFFRYIMLILIKKSIRSFHIALNNMLCSLNYSSLAYLWFWGRVLASRASWGQKLTYHTVSFP